MNCPTGKRPTVVTGGLSETYKVVRSLSMAAHREFMSHSIYLPQEDVFVVVLYNFRTASHLPEFLAGDLAALTIKQTVQHQRIVVDESLLKTYVGVYEEAV